MSQLKDLVVLELASVLAGPGVGQFFAEVGARVIKVENIKTSGDVTRSWKSRDEVSDDRSAYFSAVNWGKQSMAVDLTSAKGQRLIHQLARMSQVVIASYKPGDAEKLAVDYKTLSRDNPALIYGQISGYGSDNQRVGYDAIIQAESGFMSMNGEPGGKSLKIPVALMDILAGHHLKEGLLLALLEKERSGQGKLVEVSLIQSAVSSLANQVTNYFFTGKIPGKQGSSHPNIAPYGDVFITSDNQEVLLAVGTDRQFDDLIKILKINDIINDLSFANNTSRVKDRTTLNRILQDAIGSFEANELLKRLHAGKIPAGKIQNVEEALAQDEIQDVKISGGNFTGVRTFVAQSSSPLAHLLPPPHFGEHTTTILREMLKISPTDVADLLKQGIIR